MRIKKGMNIEEVLKVRTDITKVDESIIDGIKYESYEGEAEDGSILCIDTENGVVWEIVKAMYI